VWIYPVRTIMLPAALVLALASPALAQQTEEGTAMTPSECRALFQDADTNGDGVLSQQEIAAADLGDMDSGITVQQFVSECAEG